MCACPYVACHKGTDVTSKADRSSASCTTSASAPPAAVATVSCRNRQYQERKGMSPVSSKPAQRGPKYSWARTLTCCGQGLHSLAPAAVVQVDGEVGF